MKAFVLFSPNFLEWPLAICRALRAAEPATRICGLATGPRDAFCGVAAAPGLEADRLDHLDELERQWVATPVPTGARAAFEAKLGEDVFQRLTIADRHLGRGFIAGGETEASPLARLVQDPEILERYLVGLLGYAFDTLRNSRPDLVFCHTVDAAPALAMALTAQSLGTPFAQLRHTRIGNRVIVDTVPYDRLDPVRDLFERYVLTNAMPPSTVRAAEDYLASLRNAGTTPDYLAYHACRVHDERRPVRLLRKVLGRFAAALGEALARRGRDLRQASPLALCRQEVRVALRTARLLRCKLFQPAGWRPARPFTLYPLHVDPESSTMVQSPQHTDQLAVIEAIAKSLPGGMSLVVKEHIPMLGRRPDGFYKRLAGIPGVEFCSPFEQGTELVRDAALTAVISSTAGWESVVFGRPTLVIAFPPYAMVNDGFVAEAELTRLPAAIRAALSCPPASERRLVAYVAAALECSFACPTEVMWGKVTEQTVEENGAILTEIVGRLLALTRCRAAALRPAPQGAESLFRRNYS